MAEDTSNVEGGSCVVCFCVGSFGAEIAKDSQCGGSKLLLSAENAKHDMLWWFMVAFAVVIFGVGVVIATELKGWLYNSRGQIGF